MLCLEELDPVIERELTYICGKYHLSTKIIGKLSGDTACAGENTRDSVSNYIHTFLGLDTPKSTETSGASGSACTSSGSVCRLPAPGFFLRRSKLP